MGVESLETTSALVVACIVSTSITTACRRADDKLPGRDLALAASDARPANANGFGVTDAESALLQQDESSWKTGTSGLRETGMVAIALSRSRVCRDLVVSSGNDIFPQPLVIYRNQASMERTSFMQNLPDWISDSTGFHGPLAVGRIDDDPFPDLVVARYSNQPPEVRGNCIIRKPGSVDIIHGMRCDGRGRADCGYEGPTTDRLGFSRQGRNGPGNGPAIPDRIWPLALALGDLDADGDLDLAVAQPFSVSGDGRFRMEQLAQLASGKKSDSCHVQNTISEGRVRLYCNEHGVFTSCAFWHPAPIRATSVTLFDIDQDGLLDLVVGADRVYVHFGHRSPEGKVSIESTPGWIGGDWATQNSANTLDAQFIGLHVNWLVGGTRSSQHNTPAILAAVGCPLLAQASLQSDPAVYARKVACPGRVELYLPRRNDPDSRAPIWVSQWRGTANQVVLADLDGDGGAEAIFDGWWEAGRVQEPGVPLQVVHFALSDLMDAAPDHAIHGNEKYFIGNERLVGQAIVASDFDGNSLRWRDEDFVPSGNQIYSTLTMPSVNVEAILHVQRRTGDGSWTALDRSDYREGSDGRTIHLKRPMAAGDSMRVSYLESAAVDVAVATWDSEIGIVRYLNRLSRDQFLTGSCSQPPSKPTCDRTDKRRPCQ